MISSTACARRPHGSAPVLISDVEYERKPIDNDGNTPATKADLADLEHQLKTDLVNQERRLKAHFEGQLDALQERIMDRVRELLSDTQTELLKAFYSFAESLLPAA